MSTIVVGVDGSDQSRTALRWAADEARLRGATLLVVYVYDYTPAYERYEYPTGLRAETAVDRQHSARYAQGLVDSMVAQIADGLDVKAIAIEDRRPAHALIEQAEGADLLVVGSRGRGGFAGLVLGSVSQQCANHAPCPLTIVPTAA